MVKAEVSKLERGKPSFRDFIRRKARPLFVAAGAIELVAGPVGTAMYVNAKSNLPEARAKVIDLREANINAGAATVELTGNTDSDENIGGVVYRGATTPMNPSKAAGMVGFAETKALEAKERAIAEALSKVRQRIEVDAAERGYTTFNDPKKELRRIAREQIVPATQMQEKKADRYVDQGKKGVILAGALPAAFALGSLGYLLARPGKWVGRKIKEVYNKQTNIG